LLQGGITALRPAQAYAVPSGSTVKKTEIPVNAATVQQQHYKNTATPLQLRLKHTAEQKLFAIQSAANVED
jgi:hypothetical protein